MLKTAATIIQKNHTIQNCNFYSFLQSEMTLTSHELPPHSWDLPHPWACRGCEKLLGHQDPTLLKCSPEESMETFKLKTGEK